MNDESCQHIVWQLAWGELPIRHELPNVDIYLLHCRVCGIEGNEVRIG